LLFTYTELYELPKKLSVNPRGTAVSVEQSSHGPKTLVVNPAFVRIALLVAATGFIEPNVSDTEIEIITDINNIRFFV